MQKTITTPNDLIPIGTKVFLPRPAIGQVLEDEIKGYYGVLHNRDGNCVFTPSDYQLNTANTERGEDTIHNAWKAEEFFLSYDEAKSMAKEYRIRIDDAIAFKAIGYVADNEGYHFEPELCILAPCCSAVSNIRSILGHAIYSTRMSAVTRRTLLRLLKSHTPPDGVKYIDEEVLVHLDLFWPDQEGTL